MFILQRYPQITETYMKTEVEAVMRRHEVQIVGREPVDLPDPEHQPFEFLPDVRDVLNAIRAFKPKVLHGHYLTTAAEMLDLAERSGVPFTLRAHSFDGLRPPGRPEPRHLAGLAGILSHELCLGVVAFPFTLPLLEGLGVPRAKLRAAPPVVNFDLFHDRGPNGEGVMNTGACLPKKRMTDFLEVAARVPGRAFNLHPMGYATPALEAENRARGGPVAIHPPVPFRRMPEVYKRHRWLLYTASFNLGTVGWPMAVAEAQAAGVGVCIAGLRPDLEDYLGGAGFTYRSLEEAAEIVAGPFPEDLRERGFENARRCGIDAHLPVLTDLWEPRF